MNKMAENPKFVLSARGGLNGKSGGDGGGSGLGGNDDTSAIVSPELLTPSSAMTPTASKIKQRRGTIFASKPLTITDQYRDLLENAMYTPRRRVSRYFIELYFLSIK